MEYTPKLVKKSYADDAGITSWSRVSLAKIMTPVVKVCAAFDLFAAEKKAVAMHMHSQNLEADVPGVGGRTKYKSRSSLFSTLVKLSSIGTITAEIHSRIGQT